MSGDDTVRSMARPSFGFPLAEQAEGEGMKRRSLLPKPGPLRYSTRLHAASTAAETSVEPIDSSGDVIESSKSRATGLTARNTDEQSAKIGRLRPRSMYQPGVTSTRQTEPGDKPSIQRSIRQPAKVPKLSASNTTGLSRSQSLRKPGVQPQASTTASHSRVQSTSNISIVRRDTSKAPTTTSERPKSLLVAPSSTTRSGDSLINTVSHGPRASARLAGLNRSASTKIKPETSGNGASNNTASRAEQLLPSQSKRREVVPEEPKNASRPAFSTLQQHFTPRKTGKAPTSVFLHPVAPAGSQSMSPDIVNLQAELLQLHLLHIPAAEISRKWELSARRSLHVKFEEVASLHQVMLEHERAGQEQRNLQSLLEWSSGKSAMGVVEHIQALSGPLHELPSLVEPDGRLEGLVSEFEHWLLWVQEVRSARDIGGGAQGGLGTIEGLGDNWKAENAALIRRLSSFTHDLDSLSQPSPDSSIATMLGSCKSLLLGILSELHIMQSIETQVVMKEKDWVENRLRTIARDVGAFVVDTNIQRAAWRN